MNNQTEVSTVALGGALAVLLLIFVGPTLQAYRGEPLPTGAESALAIVLTAALAWLLPAKLVEKLRRRTRPPTQG